MSSVYCNHPVILQDANGYYCNVCGEYLDEMD